MLLFYVVLINIPLYAANQIQVDMILFTIKSNNSSIYNNPDITTGLNFSPIKQPSFKVTTNNYTVLPQRRSSLQEAYYTLQKNNNYTVLSSISWIYLPHNQKIELPYINNQGWNIKSKLRIATGLFYNLRSQLEFTTPSQPNKLQSIVFKHGLKNGISYYLDNEQLSMLIKIHTV